MNLASYLENSAERSPEKVAIRFENENITYQELNDDCNRLANGLKNLGLVPGDRCLVMLPNSTHIIKVYYALAKMGAIAVPVNFLFRQHELTHIISDAEPKAFIGSSDYLDEICKVLNQNGGPEILLATGEPSDSRFKKLDDAFADQDTFSTHPAVEDDVLSIIYTSGTTGVPKGVMLTQKNLISNSTTISNIRGDIEPDTVIIGVLPLFHIYGINSVLNSSMYMGLTVKLFPHFDPEGVIDVIEKENRTILFAVPTMYNRLLNYAADRPPQKNSLKFCVSGGASLPVEILKQFTDLFGATIYEGYGLTEAPVCIENPFGQPTQVGSIGKPIPEFSAKIIDGSGVEVATGEVGELAVKGPGVTKGYLNLPEATAKTIQDGWLHTGDIARMDEEGYFYIVDRKKDLIIRGGYNIYPREIEEILYQIPEISETAVYGIPHADLGEEIAAVVVLKEGAQISWEMIQAFIKERVAPYKYPRVVNIVTEPLPKSGSGKILKKEIRQIYV
ncbi:MAG: long-chain fatty acid--CoA ligase [SAR324 cluster bacterium]|nr:long-chain fatty acid--CoA ligase [SAR324 cluster bacterium]